MIRRKKRYTPATDRKLLLLFVSSNEEKTSGAEGQGHWLEKSRRVKGNFLKSWHQNRTGSESLKMESKMNNPDQYLTPWVWTPKRPGFKSCL